MARKFIYAVAIIIGLVIIGAIAFALNPAPFMRTAFVPTEDFTAPSAEPRTGYANMAMWIARPDMTGENPTLWRPRVFDTASYGPDDIPPPPPRYAAPPTRGDAAIFFIHPTSYLKRDHWNAPLDDAEANWRAGLFVRGMASVFADSGDVWVPRYRQAALGAFLTTDLETANQALLSAYEDVAAAFDQFLIEVGPDRPIILAGHSQGSLHLSRLLRDKVAGRPLAQRVVAAYVVGWPVSVEHDLPRMGLPACTGPAVAGCILAWQSFAEPADTDMITNVYDRTLGFDGQTRDGSRMVCVNPLTGTLDGAAERAANLGTVTPDSDLGDGELGVGRTGARCDDGARGGRGFLMIGAEPDMGGYVLPGNNYHVFDYPLFWMNVRADALARLAAYRAR